MKTTLHPDPGIESRHLRSGKNLPTQPLWKEFSTNPLPLEIPTAKEWNEDLVHRVGMKKKLFVSPSPCPAFQPAPSSMNPFPLAINHAPIRANTYLSRVGSIRQDSAQNQEMVTISFEMSIAKMGAIFAFSSFLLKKPDSTGLGLLRPQLKNPMKTKRYNITFDTSEKIPAAIRAREIKAKLKLFHENFSKKFELNP